MPKAEERAIEAWTCQAESEEEGLAEASSDSVWLSWLCNGLSLVPNKEAAMILRASKVLDRISSRAMAVHPFIWSKAFLTLPTASLATVRSRMPTSSTSG